MINLKKGKLFNIFVLKIIITYDSFLKILFLHTRLDCTIINKIFKVKYFYIFQLF